MKYPPVRNKKITLQKIIKKQVLHDAGLPLSAGDPGDGADTRNAFPLTFLRVKVPTLKWPYEYVVNQGRSYQG
jgi:hypothetical protein